MKLISKIWTAVKESQERNRTTTLFSTTFRSSPGATERRPSRGPERAHKPEASKEDLYKPDNDRYPGPPGCSPVEIDLPIVHLENWESEITADSAGPGGLDGAASPDPTDEFYQLLARLEKIEAARSFEFVGTGGDSMLVEQRQAVRPNGHSGDRFQLRLPACAVGRDAGEREWTEMATTIEVGRTGATLSLRRRVDLGTTLRVTLQLPSEGRNRDYPAPNYTVYGVVRHIDTTNDGVRVGLEFLRDQSGEADLWSRATWFGPERRQQVREQSCDVIWVEYLDESMQCIKREITRTEDVASGGMRVIAKLPPASFELVRVIYPNHAFETYAAVRNRFVGNDGLDRLCLRFLDHEWYVKLGQMSGSTGLAVGRAEISPRPKKILVADDDPPFRRVLGKVLSHAGYEVVLAEDGKMAVEKARSEKPDLVITDVLMPKMHGFLVCKAIKQFESAPKVILLTAVYTKMTYKWEAKDQYGADDMIPKPFVVADLLARIEQQLSAVTA